jgi:hypothetical protein
MQEKALFQPFTEENYFARCASKGLAIATYSMFGYSSLNFY